MFGKQPVSSPARENAKGMRMDGICLSQVQLGNPEVISVLEEALAAARAGRIAGVAIVVATLPSAISIKMAGDGSQSLAVGCAQMERMLLEQIFSPRRGPGGAGLLVPTARG